MNIYNQYQESAKKELDKDLDNYSEIVCWNKTKYEHRLSFMLDLAKRLDFSTVLDVGCGSGIYIKKLKELGLDVKGIDFSPNQIKNCETFFNLKKDVKVGSILEIEYKNNSFDLVFSMGTHLLVEDISQAINELVRVSKKYIVIDISNATFLFNKDKTKKKWTRKYISNLLKNNDLKKVSEQKFAIHKALNKLTQSKLLGWTNLFNEYSIIVLKRNTQD